MASDYDPSKPWGWREIRWHWCSHCRAVYMRCPKCGNNTCNAGYGKVDGTTCDECPTVYAVEEWRRKAGYMPQTFPGMVWRNVVLWFSCSVVRRLWPDR